MILLEIGGAIVAISIILQSIGAHCEATPNSNGSADDINENSVTKMFQNFRTNDFITFYGYLAEEHHVITPKGWKLTMFRCNSKKRSSPNKKVAIFLHGIFFSSDDIVMNKPSQGLAYVLADANFDVWILNDRGNFYSQENLFMDPNDPNSGYWDFSWDDIAFEDLPVIFDYIRRITCQPKFYMIAHSMGTSSVLALLSSRPEFNRQMHAVSLMAPAGYAKNSARFKALVGSIAKQFPGLKPQVLFPREQGCTGPAAQFCESVQNMALTQKNNTMLGTYFSHFPSGASTVEIKHYQEEIQLGYFGNQTTGLQVYIPLNYPLCQITAPLSIHYSVSDAVVVPKDVEITLSKLTGSKHLHVQKISGTFGHQDFIWGTRAKETVYCNILNFFRRFG